MLTSAAEPPSLRSLGVVSPECEARGVDFLFMGKDGLVGVQRKAVADLVSSIRSDDRLARELGQIKDGDLAHVWLLIEGDWRWSTSGESTVVRGFSRAQYDGVVAAVQVEYGVHVMTTDSLEETRETLKRLESWHAKAKHGSLQVRPKARAVLQNGRGREWAIHLLQSFPGVSYGRAAAIFDAYGYLPLCWAEEDFEKVDGIGKKTAQNLRDALAYTAP